MGPSRDSSPRRKPGGSSLEVTEKNDIARKAEYVRRQGQTREHRCHWPSCGRQVPPAMFMCKAHWYKLPKSLRDRIWATYQIGQEVTMTPSKAYIAAAREVQAWIRANADASAEMPLFDGEDA